MSTKPTILEDGATCDPIAPFIDERGVIQPIIDTDIGGCAIITSKPGAVRANHFHKTDWHYCYVISGSIKYFHRPVGADTSPETMIYGPGSVFYSPPMVEHAMEFLEETTFIVVSKLSRDHDDYENDVMRVDDLTRA
ncbi:MAG: cupin domain-containing protein [Pseudomonadota bacterium]